MSELSCVHCHHTNLETFPISIIFCFFGSSLIFYKYLSFSIIFYYNFFHFSFTSVLSIALALLLLSFHYNLLLTKRCYGVHHIWLFIKSIIHYCSSCLIVRHRLSCLVIHHCSLFKYVFVNHHFGGLSFKCYNCSSSLTCIYHCGVLFYLVICFYLVSF